MNRTEYVRAMHSKLDHWNQEIDALVARRHEVEESTRLEVASRLDDFRARRDEAKKKLLDLEQAGDCAWQDMKAGVELAWDAMGQAINSARSQFKH